MEIRQTIPHSPILAENGQDTPDYRLAYLRKMDDWRSGTREQALIAWKNSPEYSNIDKYIRYLEGNQLDARRARYRSSFVENKLELTRREKLALFTDTRPIMDVTSNIDAYDDVAQVINKVIRAEWQRQSESDVLVDTIDIAMLHGTSFAKLGASSPGKSRVIACGPDNVIPIQPSKSTLQDAVAIYYRTWKPISYFKRVFPLNSQGLENMAKHFDSRSSERYLRPGHIPETTWSQMNPYFKKMIGLRQYPEAAGAATKYYGSLELEEYYVDDISINESNRKIIMKDQLLPQGSHNWWYEVKPGQRLYPRKRLVIYGGDRLLYDGPAPFWSGLYPFAELRLNPVPWSYYGYSTYRPLMGLQDAINEIPAGALDMIKRILHPTVIAKTNVVAHASWKEYLSDRPGARLIVNPNVNITEDIKYGENPELPEQVFEYYQSFLQEFDKMSGMLDIASLSQKKQMPAGETLDQMRDALQTPLRREERNIETFLQRCGTLKTSNVIQFYTAKQRLKLLGENGLTWEDFLYEPGSMNLDNLNKEQKEAFWMNFGCQVEPGSLHSGAQDRSKIESIQLAKMGLISRQELFRRLDIDPEHAQKIMQELSQETQALAEQMNAGRTPRSASDKAGQ